MAQAGTAIRLLSQNTTPASHCGKLAVYAASRDRCVTADRYERLLSAISLERTFLQAVRGKTFGSCIEGTKKSSGRSQLGGAGHELSQGFHITENSFAGTRDGHARNGASHAAGQPNPVMP
jgi:hypothetical protein